MDNLQSDFLFDLRRHGRSELKVSIMSAHVEFNCGTAGIYGAVLAEGMVRKGDPVELLP